MKHVIVPHKRAGFKVLLEGTNAQAAVMILSPGGSSSNEPENEHPRAEQWVYVVSGTGEARTEKSRRRLFTGSLLLVEQNEPHQITNVGRTLLVTLNIYAPIAYTRGDKVKLTARTPPLLAKVKALGKRLGM